MADVAELQTKYRDQLAAMYAGYYVTGEIQTRFPVEIVNNTLRNSGELISNMVAAVTQPVVDFNQLANVTLELKNSVSGICAKRVEIQCTHFGAFCKEEYLDGCVACLQNLSMEYDELKKKFETLFKLEEEIISNGGTILPLE